MGCVLTFAHVAQLAERYLGKVKVTSSILVMGSIIISNLAFVLTYIVKRMPVKLLKTYSDKPMDVTWEKSVCIHIRHAWISLFYGSTV